MLHNAFVQLAPLPCRLAAVQQLQSPQLADEGLLTLPAQVHLQQCEHTQPLPPSSWLHGQAAAGSGFTPTSTAHSMHAGAKLCSLGLQR